MSKQKLKMMYHPAKKEVKFQRIQNGKEVEIKKTSRLKVYENKRGSFVLQDHGDAFFDDIAAAFDSETVVNIEVITTKNDYGDFEQMVEFYNNGSPPVTINATLIAELPDMDEVYRTVKEYGENSVNILNAHRVSFYEVLSNDSPREVKDCVNSFSEEVQKEVESIKEKTTAISDANVNLCFTGVFSAGKSALINAIIGYAILPEAIKSETARMFEIRSPKAGESVRLNFVYRHELVDIVWNETKKVFDILAGPVEDDLRANIQTVINEKAGELQHIQLCEILRTLNKSGNNNVSTVKIYFPIPLDNEKVQFTIYDTPGTDSNYMEHQNVLKDAISEQTHSILIFVVAPDRTEGEGNIALLSYLKEAENKDSKTSIDLGRSLFVVNRSDSVSLKERNELQTAEIKNKRVEAESNLENDSESEDANINLEEEFSIKLCDKKLFFTSAMYANTASAIKNRIATKEQEYIIEDDYSKILREDRGRYFMQNRCGASELATKRQHEKSIKSLDDAIAKKDAPEVFHICSGVYALEEEIVQYGEKYASAVKTFAIIDTVDKTLTKLNSRASSMKKQNIEDIKKADETIRIIRETLTEGIDKAYKKHEIPSGKALPDGVATKLKIDAASIKNALVKEPTSFIDKLLKGWFFGRGKVRYNEKHKQKIEGKIREVLDDFTRDFLTRRRKLLVTTRDEFIEGVKTVIRNNGDISAEAKGVIMDIRPPEVANPSDSKAFGELYDNNKRMHKFLWFDMDSVNKDALIIDVEEKLTGVVNRLTEDYTNDFHNTLDSLLTAIKTEFVANLDKYSLQLKATIADRKAIEELGKKISVVADALQNRQQELEKRIWGLQENE